MKIIYSELKKLLPSLTTDYIKLRDDLTMIGHFTNFFEEIDDEIVFDLDIKVNRGDCLGYYGLAKDLSVFYNIPLKELSTDIKNTSTEKLPIKIDTKNVKRVMSIKISNLKNSSSPNWLQNFLKFHNSKSINTVVDLTNYIMFLYGIPNHAFDTAKSGESLIWEMNPKYKEFISLDGSKLNLNENILMINNSKKALSLSFWGGEACAIDLNTTETIIEVAIYNPIVVRQNSRQLKSITEASVRLEKDLDTELIAKAFNHLINLILENCQGQISSQVFDYYPNPPKPIEIKFDPIKPSLIAGIKIPINFSIDVLKRLGSTIDESNSKILITPPSIRKDIYIEHDLVEEVVRFWGFQKIPTDEPLVFKQLPDITPKEIYLIEKLKDELTDLGYDEILSWPLVTNPYQTETVIKTQNSINSEAIYLRQSLIPSLEQQLNQYTRFKLSHPQFFEIGKIFNQKNGEFVEQNSLCLYNFDSQKLQRDIKDLNLSIIKKGPKETDNFAEIVLDDLDQPKNYTPKKFNNNAYELKNQIITLDANLNLNTKSNPLDLIKKYSQIIGPEYLWKLIITDIYQDQKTNKYRYTFQASYFNLDDKTAKKIHLKSFGLI